MSFPKTLAGSALLGIWLMFSPWAFGTTAPAAHIDHLAGALVVTVSIICMGEVVRIGRHLNVLLGLTVAAAPWFLDGAPPAARINDLVVGLASVALALPRGPITESYGSWDRYVR
jgi:hypothetical protein